MSESDGTVLMPYSGLSESGITFVVYQVSILYLADLYSIQLLLRSLNRTAL